MLDKTRETTLTSLQKKRKLRHRKVNLTQYTEQIQAKRWAEHFTEVLNTEAPTITADPPAPNDDLDIATGVPTLQEVTHAIKQMKTGKSPAIDNICIELLKTDVITAGNVFTDLFSDIWTANEIPRDWNKGLIVKIPKKGDLQNCDNWRGITLLSMPGKIFCRVSQLEDLDYADDIALFSTNARHLQQKENVLNENVKKAGLHINTKKTKVMHLNLTEPHPQIMIDGDEVEAGTTLLIWEATLVSRTVFRRISQLELTKQDTVIAASVTYGNQTYMA